MLTIIACIVIAYLIGSLSSAIIYCKLAGLPDPRSEGSGNPGATNVLRFGGKKAAAIVLVGDVLKGVLAVLIASLFNVDGFYLSLAALAAFAGHIFPIFFAFKGGKGVATAFGGILALSWPIGLTIAAIWLLVAILFRYSSLAALIATLLAPILMFLYAPDYAIAVVIMSIMIFWYHADNIKRLLNGTESKIGR